MLIPLILALLQATPPGAHADTALVPDSADLATAYATPATRELVRAARAQRDMIDASVFRYRATVRQRLSVGLRAFRRDRLVYRRETAALVDWRRDGPTRVEVVGAREAVPLALPGLRVPDELDETALGMIPRPGGNRLIFDATGDGFAWHPLIDGGEAVYRYAIGDSTEIRLPDGRRIRLVELRVTPRERDIRLITGSFWIDRDSHGIVQAAFRPAREFDLERDLPRIDPEETAAEEVPDVLKPIRFDARYISLDYGLFEMRWWMPRVVVLDAWVQVGPARVPIRYEITYSDYEVEPDRHGLPELPPVIRKLAGDPTATAAPFEHGAVVVVPDTLGLLHSPLLPSSLYAEDAELISESELREMARRLDLLPPEPWVLGAPQVAWPWTLGTGLLRYNRVEGLSAGARAELDLGRAVVDLTARAGSADLEPGAELGVAVPTLRRTWRAAAYRRLAAADPAVRPFGLGASLGALLLGRDDGTYFRATGGELLVTPEVGEGRWALRLYAEHQEDVDVMTSFSLPGLLEDGWTFRPNIHATTATQVGIATRVDIDRGIDPRGFRWGARLDVTAEAGDFRFIRPGVALRMGAPLPGRLLFAAEAAGGTTVGTAARPAPPQSLWYLGGPPTLRGFPGGAAAGPDYLRTRIEVGTSFPAARLAAFSDAGWAGERETFVPRNALVSAGLGASFLDGLIRVDLARAVHPDPQWRLELYTDAIF